MTQESTTKVGQLMTKGGRPTIAELAMMEEIMDDQRQCIDDQQEQVKALTAELEDARRDYHDAQADTIADLGQSLILCQRERRGMEEELSRLRALQTAVKTMFTYLPKAVNELLTGDEDRFARDTMGAAFGLLGEALADD